MKTPGLLFEHITLDTFRPHDDEFLAALIPPPLETRRSRINTPQETTKQMGRYFGLREIFLLLGTLNKQEWKMLRGAVNARLHDWLAEGGDDGDVSSAAAAEMLREYVFPEELHGVIASFKRGIENVHQDASQGVKDYILWSYLHSILKNAKNARRVRARAAGAAAAVNNEVVDGTVAVDGPAAANTPAAADSPVFNNTPPAANSPIRANDHAAANAEGDEIVIKNEPEIEDGGVETSLATGQKRKAAKSLGGKVAKKSCK